MGSNNTIFGNVDPTVAKNAFGGDGNTIIGATDARGNVIINHTMAVGVGAKANNGSIAIGAYANAYGISEQQIADNNVKILSLLNEIKVLLGNDNSQEAQEIVSSISDYNNSTQISEKASILKRIFTLQNAANLSQIFSFVIQLLGLVVPSPSSL